MESSNNSIHRTSASTDPISSAMNRKHQSIYLRTLPRRTSQMSQGSESEASDYVPSDEEDTVPPAKPKPLARKGTQPKRASKKQAVEEVVASPRKQLSQRKRQSSRVSPPVGSKETSQLTPKVKKQKIQTPPPLRLTRGGEEAVQLVDAEIEKLPPESDLKYTELDLAGKVYGFRSSEIPELHGTKAHPEGHPECLTGKTFVISGVLETLTRDEATHLVKAHGGRVTTAVSGKTTFLLVGNEAGKTKCETARDKGAKLIDEEGLFRMIKAASLSHFEKPAPEPSSAKSELMDIDSNKHFESNPTITDANELLGQDLWVDKYKPECVSDLVGNPSMIGALRDWLEKWRGVHLFHESIPNEEVFGTRQTDARGKRAVLISGAPGVGKTTAAHLVCRELGFIPVEVNASDTRNKADKISKRGIAGKMANKIEAICQNASVGHDFSSGAKHLVLIMDEVDGMSGGDRGGVTDLIKNIKTARIPIICICNDKYNRKLTSLKNHCMELDFRKPTRAQLIKRVSYICQTEGLTLLTMNVMDALIEQAHGDVRTLIGGLQFIRAKTTTVSYKDVEKGRVSILKNQDMSPFETTRYLLSPESSLFPLNTKSDAVFKDMDLVPLLVQENYLNHIPRDARTEQERLKSIAKAASYISFGERVNAAVYSQQKWSLMPSVVQMGTLAPASIMMGRRETFNPPEPNFTRFTTYLGNLSTTNKQYRLLQSAVTRMSSTSRWSIDKQAAAMDYFPVMRQLLTQPLIKEDASGISDVFDLMKEYCIDKEHYDFIMDVTQFKSTALWAENPLPKIATKVKSMLTRQVNTARICCAALPGDVGPADKAVKKEEVREEPTAVVPDTGVIQETFKEELEEEEDVDQEDVIVNMKEAGYQLKPSMSKSRGGSTKAEATSSTDGRKSKTSRGRGGWTTRGGRGRGRGRKK